MAVNINVAKINRVVCASRDGGIAARADALGVGHGSHHPAQSIVGGDGNARTVDAIGVHTPLIGYIRGTIRRNPHVTVQPSASSGGHRKIDPVHRGERINRNARAECKAAIIAPRAKGGDDVLRTIINSVRIVDFDRGHGRSVWTAAYRLMIDTCGLAGTLRGEPIVPVIVGKGKFASHAIELRGKGAIRAAEVAIVRKKDWIEAHACKRRALILPDRSGRVERIIESYAESVVSGFDKSFTCRPVNANGRLPGAVGARGGRSERWRDAARRRLVLRTILRRWIVDESGCAGSRRRRRWSGGARRDRHRDNDMSARRHW